MDPVMMIAQQLLGLTAMGAVGGPLHAGQIILFKQAITLTNRIAVADLIVADFTGYAPVAAIAFGTPYVDQVGVARFDAPSVDFVMTDEVAPNTIYGWALLNTGGSAVLLVSQFTTPIPLTRTGQGLRVQPTYPYGA
jgi:hypothetical protein